MTQLDEISLGEPFSEAEQAMIVEELALHHRVKEAVRRAALEKLPDMEGIKSRLLELRDEAIHASERDLPSLFQMLNTHHSLASRDYTKILPDMRAPYFGRMRLVEDGKTKDVLIGYQTFIDHEDRITIVDWRHAAIAKVFFNFREGDDYEVQLPGRVAEGTMILRRLIAFEVGELTGITTPELSLYKPRGGQWVKATGGSAKLAAGARRESGPRFGTGGTQQGHFEISSLLDAEQYEILTRDAHQPLLVLGGAGCGKTTVALHRMSQIHYNDRRFFAENAMMVIVPEQGLVRLSERLLRNLGLKHIPVTTYDSWVTRQARRILRKVPRRICSETPSDVILIKRHPAMRDVIAAYVDDWAGRLLLKFQRDVVSDESFTKLWQGKMPLAKRIEAVGRAVAGSGQSDSVKHAARRFVEEAMADLFDFEGVRGDIYTREKSQQLLATVDEISPNAIKTLTDHCRRQYTDPDGGRLSAADRQNIKTVDGADLDEDDFYMTIDVEDFTVLLLYIKALVGKVEWRGHGLSDLSHVVIDEAQDLSILETELIGDALKPEASVTVAGDPAQQSDPTVQFAGWDEMFRSLGLVSVAPTHLKMNYRCPRPIADYGHQVLGDLAPAKPPTTLRDGVPVLESRYPTSGLALVSIAETLEDLLREEPTASVAVIAREEERAREIFDGLKSNLDVRLILDGEFSFQPGIDITILEHVKGLEFDYVIIPDAEAGVYPDTPVSRRALHIAVTRAVHQLWVQTVGVTSPVIAQ